jgi:D-alanyl-D-alanine carboxypeptidase/D-alanyl-D-alanine carboxypeptidase (penicillin-binding protein 5/6)
MRWKRWAAALTCSALLLFYADGLTVQAAPAVSSLSAVVYEPESGLFLYEKDARTARPMASTTKLMTALLTVENLDPNAIVTVPTAALPVEGSQIGLKAGQETTVRDLLAGLLLASGNDTANALALLMEDSLPSFAERMNRRALTLGMTDSLFVTPSGLDEGGHSASARDMALLGAAVLTKPLLAELCASKVETIAVGGVKMTVSNHNKLLKLYDGTIGLKTGFTKKAGRCLVSAVERDGVTLVVATLNGGDYWNDHIALYDYAFSLVHRETMPDVSPETCPVAGGTVQTVPIAPQGIPSCVLREGERVTAQVDLPRFVWAPIAPGDVLGYVRYTAGDRELARVPIRATARVAERELPPRHVMWWRRFCLFGESLLK